MPGWRLRWLPPASTIEPSSSGARRFGWIPTICVGTSRSGQCSAGPWRCRAKRSPSAARFCDQEPDAVEAIVILGSALAAQGEVERSDSPPRASLGARSTERPGPIRPGPGSLRSRAVSRRRRSSQRGDSSSARRCADVVADGLDSGDEPGSARSAMERGRSNWPIGDPAFRRPRAAGLRCAGRGAGRNRGVLRGRRRGRASVDRCPGPRRQRVGRRH